MKPITKVNAGLCLACTLALWQAAPIRAQSTAPTSAQDPCRLVTGQEVRSVQGDAVKGTKASVTSNGRFISEQCFYTTMTFANSVSLALARPDPKRGGSGPRQYWMERFRRESGKAGASTVDPGKKEAPPRPVARLGEEAFWVGDRINGALYVLRGDEFLRISVGGSGDEGRKLDGAAVLARAALSRLAGSRGVAGEPKNSGSKIR